MSLKVITLNLEGNKHLHRALPFLQVEQPDVICLQEAFGRDFSHITETLGMQGVFVPLMTVLQENKYGIPPLGESGLMLLSHHQLQSVTTDYYAGDANVLPEFTQPNSLNRALLSATVEKDGEQFLVMTTHFTWSTGGSYSPEQQKDFAQLTQILEEKRANGEFILAGDFNAPRGGEVYQKLSEFLTDNVPPEVSTTLDPDLHYAASVDKNLQLVVDYLWTTPGLRAHDARVVSGVSDHQAVVGEVEWFT